MTQYLGTSNGNLSNLTLKLSQSFHSAGIILVHDLTNRKSQLNLRRWLSEVLIKEGGGTKARTPLVEEFDAEQFGGFAQVYGVKKVAILCSFFSRFSLSYLALLGAWGICMSTRGKLEFCRWLLLFCFSLVCFTLVKCLDFFIYCILM